MIWLRKDLRISLRSKLETLKYINKMEANSINSKGKALSDSMFEERFNLLKSTIMEQREPTHLALTILGELMPQRNSTKKKSERGKKIIGEDSGLTDQFVDSFRRSNKDYSREIEERTEEEENEEEEKIGFGELTESIEEKKNKRKRSQKNFEKQITKQIIESVEKKRKISSLFPDQI